ncbi:hypothetical protein [Herbaspirillum sp. alder98]|uniref:hypothetical protein n=1 Tax=Herbaspirillum sp. alder98 TaxID=2913096 RepID=UPI001CD8986F|nr:hypothetical protein [Herbaspirillum sp. alder98]MCA1324339.1 hypothetical protein [Herbaspirillum sp. alder98]
MYIARAPSPSLSFLPPARAFPFPDASSHAHLRSGRVRSCFLYNTSQLRDQYLIALMPAVDRTRSLAPDC